MSNYELGSKNQPEANSEPIRTILVKASNLESSYTYQKGFKKGKRIDVSKFGEGAYVAPDMLVALEELAESVRKEGGSFYITDLFRSWDTQKKARLEFLSGTRKDFIAPPGGSFHNAGRAVDFDVKNLNFQGVPRKLWLEKLWQLAIPLGFSPIIKIPDINASESWHLDYPGKDWQKAYNSISYSEVAKCAILDCGKYKERNKETLKNMFIQSQLIRLGFYEIGSVDGILGEKTKKVLTSLGIDSYSTDEAIKFLKQR